MDIRYYLGFDGGHYPVVISSNKISSILESYACESSPKRRLEGPGARPHKTSGNPAAKDTLSISPKIRKAQEIEAHIKSLPEVRSKYIERLASLVAKGEYHVDAEDIAESILQHLISEESV